MGSLRHWSYVLITAGNIAMIVGAIDPIEGSLLILPGSGFVALGTFFNDGERRFIVYRIWVFILIGIGVTALWVLSAVGGFGGSSGLSNWWGVLVLPYLIGLSMGIWGPDSPRWMLWLGLCVGLWYLTILGTTVVDSADPNPATSILTGIVMGISGALTIGGCIFRLNQKTPERYSI